MGKKDVLPINTAAINPNLKNGTPRKRVLRACNECRSHKARCDGKEVCETCRRYDRVCRYKTPIAERIDPASKIRALEESLMEAKRCIKDLQHRLPKDIDVQIRRTSHVEGIPEARQNAQTAGNTRIDTTTTTGLGLIGALLRPLFYHEDIKNLIRSSGTGEFMRRSPTANKLFHTTLYQLPLHATMIETVSAAFDCVFGLCNIVVEQDFYTAAQALYDSHPMSYTQEHGEFVPLFLSVMALGMTYRTGVHRDNGCEQNAEESQYYFAAASAAINFTEDCMSSQKLQAALCMTLYLVNTSKPDLARRQMQAILSSSTVQHSLGIETERISQTQPSIILKIPDQLLWLMCYLDMHVSNLLGLAPLLDVSMSTSTTTPVINMAAHNVAFFKRSDSAFLSEVSLAMAVELEALTQRVNAAGVAVKADSDSTSSSRMVGSGEMQASLNNVQIDFATWEHIFQCIFSDDDNNPRIALAQNELQMHYYTAQIVSLHGHLAHHSQSPLTDDPDHLDRICKGRACVIAASNAILSTADRVVRMQMTSLTWLSAYTVFISAVTLLTAFSYLNDTDFHTRDAIQRTFQTAVHVLRYKSYHASQGKSTYLDFLTVVSAKLQVELEPAPAHREVSCTSASSHTSESFEQSPSVFSTSTSLMDGKTKFNRFESWWQWPTEEETLAEDWGFD